MPLPGRLEIRPSPSHYLAPVEVHIIEGEDRCHTKCTCDVCLNGARPAEPHTDSSGFVLSQQEADHLNSGDWSELASLYNSHAPLSICRYQDALAAPPWSVVEPVADTSIATYEGDWRIPVAHDDLDTINGSLSTGLTENDVAAGVIHLFASFQIN